MSEHIGMFDAKTRFSEIVRMVKLTGRRVIVTNRGEEMVVIAPISDASAAAAKPRAAFDAIEHMRRSFRSSTRAQNRAAIDEGRS